MAVSPMKRVTRARAATKTTVSKVDDMNAATQKTIATKAAAARKAKIMANVEVEVEAPNKSTTTKKVAAVAATTRVASAPRRRVKVTPLDMPAAEPEPMAEDLPEEPKTRSSARSKKAPTTTKKSKAKPTESSDDAVPAVKTRSRMTTTTEETVEGALPVPKTRGRPKKAADSQPAETTVVEEPKRQTRTRAASGASATQATATSAAKPSAALRKKVTFQDLPEGDKENVPIVSKRATTKKDNTPNATGIRAKPVRKPAAAGTRKKTASSKTKEPNAAPRALTPKKITQVARSFTPEDSEEDELNGGKTPVRDLSMSPRRMPTTSLLTSPVKQLDFTPALRASSPERTMQISGILSPARRPPPSPFKDALKESPKRGEAVPIFPVAAVQPAFGAAMLAAPTTVQSTLLQSPKRGPLDNSMFSRSSMKPATSPFKASLLQSPARRLFSPQKQKTMPLASTKAESTTPKTSDFPNTAMSCLFRASQSPERLDRVHTLSEEELAREAEAMVDFDESVLNIQSPMKLSKPHTAPLITEEDPEQETFFHHDREEVSKQSTTPAQNNTDDVFVENQDAIDVTEPIESIAASVTGRDLEVHHSQQPLSNILFKTSKFRDDDESSEDELTADMTPDRPLMRGRPSLSTANIRSRLSAGASAVPPGMGFTPLAVQLSGWLASSPEKHDKKGDSLSEETFSPVAAQHIPGEVQVSRQSTPQQLRSSRSSRTPVAARQPAALRKSVGSRLSLAPSAAETPGKSFFAEEMSLRELLQESEDFDVTQEDIDLHDMIEEPIPQPEEIQGASGGRLDTLDENISTEDHTENELTTDLINQNMYTDTALVDLAALAKEADDLAPNTDGPSQRSSSPSLYGDENAAPAQLDAPVVEMQSPESPDVIAVASTTPLRSPAPATIPFNDVATPMRPDLSLPRFVNTVVSKVPLRPEGDISPIKMPRKRSRSLSQGPPSAKRSLFSVEDLRTPKSKVMTSTSPERRVRSACPSPAASIAASTPGQRSFAVDDFGDSTLDGIEMPDNGFSSDEDAENEVSLLPATTKSTPAATRSSVATPARTPLKAVGNGVLHGAVVFVDVHTTEGADASGIFVELLTQMGAKCVKEWRWNPRASHVAAAEEGENVVPTKATITHVVFKDGGKRTLEKVRDAKGEVWCVGVGWVLDCERESKWLDEAAYAVDTSIVPRGGSRRRKSMEPRALMNANGSLGVAKGRRSVSGEMTSQMREELVNTPVRGVVSLPKANEERASIDSNNTTASVDSKFSTPTGVQDKFASDAHLNEKDEDEDEDEDDENLPAAATPTAFVDYDPATSGSPMTPFLMGQGSKLVQMSCPPKQIGKSLFDNDDEDAEEKENHNKRTTTAAYNNEANGSKTGFPVSGKLEDEKDEGMRRRLEAARRRTMGWKPRVGSPLGRLG